MSFTCAADYSKKIQFYEWEQNNVRLPNNDRYTVKNDGQTLEISQTKFEDRGDYRCVATRKGKDLGTSQNAALNIKGTCDSTLLSQTLGRSFLVPVLFTSLSLSVISRGLFSLVVAGGHEMKSCTIDCTRVEIIPGQLPVYNLAKRPSQVNVLDLVSIVLPKVKVLFVLSQCRIKESG